MEDVEGGRAAAIVVAKLDRLSRSLPDFANLTIRSLAGDWNLVVLYLGIDLSTRADEFVANVWPPRRMGAQIVGQRTPRCPGR